jgi:hypothetical protein
MSADINGLAERSGGFFAPLDTGSPRGHELTRTAPRASAGSGCEQGGASAGSIASRHDGLTCVDCHDPHGNDNPRNLRLPSATGASPALGLLVSPDARGLDRYERRNVRYGTLGSDELREVSALCLDCHRDVAGSAGPGAGDHHTKHPSYDSQSGNTNTIAQAAAHAGAAGGHWMGGNGSGFEGTDRVPFVVPGATDFAGASVVDPARNSVFCLSCHKAHGSGAAFGLTWTSAARGIGPRGCDQCHGLAATSPVDLLAGPVPRTGPSRPAAFSENRR